MQGPLDNDVEQLIERAQRITRDHVTVTQRARVLREMSVDARLARRLHRLAGIGPHAGLEVTLREAVDAAIDVLGADFGNIQRVYRGRGLELVAHRGFDDPFLDYFAYVNDTSTPCGVALRAGDLVCVKDVARSELFQGTEALDHLLAAGVRAVSSMPLTSKRGEVIGMLSIHYRSPRDPSATEQLRMRALARAVGRAMDR